jgi:hypothetical protein
MVYRSLTRTTPVFVRDRVVLVHDLKTMVSFTVFFRDRVVLGHDLKAMVSFTVFVGDRVVLVHNLETKIKPWLLDHELRQHDL